MIYVVKHKPYDLPELPDGYKSICVGGYSEPGAFDCSEGENLERFNIKLNELTAFWWLWKHTDDPVIGVDHYRAYLTDNDKNILTMPQVEEMLEDNDIILHAFQINCTVETNVIMSGLNGGGRAVDIVRRLLPDGYGTAWDEVMYGKWYHIANLMIARREIFDAYCEWLFPFIIEAAKEYRPNPGCLFQEKRAVGYVAEAMLSVWVRKQNLKVKEVPAIMLPYETGA